jgi:hypothetical protein
MVNLFIHQAQCQFAQGQVIQHAAKLNSVKADCRYPTNLAQEHQQDLIQEESKWMQVVADVEAHVHQRVNEAFASVLELESKTQRLSCNRNNLQEKNH